MITFDPSSPSTTENNKGKRLIAIVGPCGAGKTTLEKGLRALGYNARAIVQEHSYVQTMWRQLTNPDILIFLQASHAVGKERRGLNWSPSEWQEQQLRLTHARNHAHFYFDTDGHTIHEVLQGVIQFLNSLEED